MDASTDNAAGAESPRPIEEAATKTAQVQQELSIAEAELELTNTVLGRTVPQQQEDDVRKAVAQNIVIEEKVGEAAEDLQHVTELLQSEVSERERLERELEQSRSPS